MRPDESTSLISAWQPRIRAFFVRRLGQGDEVDDLVQEAVTSIFRCYHAFAHRSSVSTWVYAVCRNVISNFYHYRERDKRLAQRLHGEQPPVDAASPLAVRQVIQELGKDQQMLYHLFYVEG